MNLKNEQNMTQITRNNEMASEENKPASAADDANMRFPASARKKIIRWGGAGLAILALVLGIRYYLYSLSHESTDDAFIDGNIVPLSPRVAGHVARVYAKDNRLVKTGDLLVELDPRDFEARLEAAKAALEAAKAADQARNVAVELTEISATSGLNEAENSMEAEKASVQEAEARLVFCRASLDQAVAEANSARARHQLDEKDLIRYREMEKTQTVSVQDLDHAVTAEQISASTLASAEKKIETQKASIQQAEAELKAEEANLRRSDAHLSAARSVPQQIAQSRSQADVSHADINKVKAELAQAGLNLSYTKIYAPCDGFVTEKAIEPGQFVQAGQSLMAIVSRRIWVTANFKETQLTHMKPGQPVEITVDTYSNLSFHGHVDSIQHGTGSRFSLLPPENATGNFVKVVQRVPVKIVFERPEDIDNVLLPPGMSVVPDVNVGAKGWPAGSLEDSESRPGPTSEKSGAVKIP
jgi:membrane fusion protein, multidrug efflux system